MSRRQSLPEAWLITDQRIGASLLPVLRRVPSGTGVILRTHADERQQILRLGRARGLLIVEEGRGAVRVHNAREVRRARLVGGIILLLSPMFATRSHPGRPALPRMRAAALARLAGRPLLALGGMNSPRFQRVRALGFDGWAGIDAWL